MGTYEPLDPAIDAAMSMNGDIEALRRYYDDWAGAYDHDVDSHRYALPDQVSRLLAEVVVQDRGEPIEGLLIDPAPPAASILDVGCGTGLVGHRLAADGYEVIDGVDLSPAMTDVAETRACYRTLTSEVDITAPLPEDLIGRYDIVIAGGVFTVGHVPPSTLGAVASLARPGGLLIISTRIQYYKQTGYQAESDRLEQQARITLLRRNADAPYTLDSPGHYWAYGVLG